MGSQALAPSECIAGTGGALNGSQALAPK